MKSFSLALVLVLAVALAGCHGNPFHKMYSATAEIEAKPSTPPPIPSMYDDKVGYPDGPTQIAREINVMQGPDILTPVIQKLKLDQIWAKRLHSGHDTLSPEEALDHLHKALKIENLRGTDIVRITDYSEVPQEAADIANALADEYKAQRDQKQDERNKKGVEVLKDQIDQQSEVVANKKAAAEKQRQILSQKNLTITASPDDSDKSPFAPYRAAQREYEEQQSVLDALNIRLKQLTVDQNLQESPVRIISRAEVPSE